MISTLCVKRTCSGTPWRRHFEPEQLEFAVHADVLFSSGWERETKGRVQHERRTDVGGGGVGHHVARWRATRRGAEGLAGSRLLGCRSAPDLLGVDPGTARGSVGLREARS